MTVHVTFEMSFKKESACTYGAFVSYGFEMREVFVAVEPAFRVEWLGADVADEFLVFVVDADVVG